MTLKNSFGLFYIFNSGCGDLHLCSRFWSLLYLSACRSTYSFSVLSCIWSFDFTNRSCSCAQYSEAGKSIQITRNKGRRRIIVQRWYGCRCFTVVLQLAVGKEVDLGIENISLLLLHEAGGGLLLGVLLGWVTSRLMREVDDYIISVLVTLSVVMGGYLIARQLHISGPLTMVAAGLFMGNFNVNFKMKSVTQDYLIKFWELIDEILNAVLFLFIGFELLMIKDLQNFIIP